MSVLVMRGSREGPPPLENENILLHSTCKFIASMHRTPLPPDKHNYRSDPPSPWKKFSGTAHACEYAAKLRRNFFFLGGGGKYDVDA